MLVYFSYILDFGAVPLKIRKKHLKCVVMSFWKTSPFFGVE